MEKSASGTDFPTVVGKGFASPFPSLAEGLLSKLARKFEKTPISRKKGVSVGRAGITKRCQAEILSGTKTGKPIPVGYNNQ